MRKTFELYATSRFSLESLGDAVFKFGLRNKNGQRVSRSALSTMLNNPFYIGLMRLHKTGEAFPGKHEPIVKVSVFRRVQNILAGKTALCQHYLIAERQKGGIYYRCHTKTCPMKCVREDAVHAQIDQQMEPFQFTDADSTYLRWRIAEMRQDWIKKHENQISSVSINIVTLDNKLNRLTDAYLDGAIDRDMFERKKAAFLLEKKTLEEQMGEIMTNPQSLANRPTPFWNSSNWQKRLFSLYFGRTRRKTRFDQKHDLELCGRRKKCVNEAESSL